jgi:hypothetical protein
MDKTTLVEKDIQAGAELIRNLDNLSFEVVAALWFYELELNEWQLIIASPKVKKGGPIQAYQIVQDIIKKFNNYKNYSINNIKLVSPDYPLIQILRSVIRTQPIRKSLGGFSTKEKYEHTIANIRFTRNTINNYFIEDAYIYRVE